MINELPLKYSDVESRKNCVFLHQNQDSGHLDRLNWAASEEIKVKYSDICNADSGTLTQENISEGG